MRGGLRPGSGRPPGAKNKRTSLVAKAAAAEGLSPVEYMLRIMRDEKKPVAVRLDAAKAAAPYVHPRLSAVQLDLHEVSDGELLRAVAA